MPTVDWCMAGKPKSSITDKNLSPTCLHRISSKSTVRMWQWEASTDPMARHGTVPCTVHLLDEPWVSLRAAGRVPIRADSPSTNRYSIKNPAVNCHWKLKNNILLVTWESIFTIYVCSRFLEIEFLFPQQKVPFDKLSSKQSDSVSDSL